MKALVKTQKGKGFISVIDVPIPVIPHDDWVLIEVKAAGVCGTDLHIWHDEFPYWPPVTLGHEFSGVIAEVGGAVKRFKPGDRVVAEPHSHACGVCYLCRQGRDQLCAEKRSPGWGINGAFTEFVVMPEKLLHRIPDNVSFEVAALAEPLAIAIHHVTERCGIEYGDTVFISGAGPVGILAALVAKSCGAKTTVMTGLDAAEFVRFKIAKELGTDFTVNVEKGDPSDLINRLTDGIGADVFVETSGAGAAISQGIRLLKKCGRICAIGMSSSERIAVAWSEAVQKSLDIFCCMSSSYTSWDKALTLMSTTDMDLSKLITRRANISEWESVFDDLTAERGVKAVFIP